MTLLAPGIVNDVSYVTQITDDIDFVWPAQYLVKLECDFSWQAQHFVTFLEIAGARNVVFFNEKSSPRWSLKRRVRDDDFVFGLSSDHARIMLESSLYWRKHFREFLLKSRASRFRGRRSTW